MKNLWISDAKESVSLFPLAAKWPSGETPGRQPLSAVLPSLAAMTSKLSFNQGGIFIHSATMFSPFFFGV